MALSIQMRVMLVSLQILWTTYGFCQMIVAVLKNPFKALRKKSRKGSYLLSDLA